MKDGGFEGLFASENGNLLAGGAKDFVDVVSNGSLAGGAGDGDKFHIFDRIAIVRI